MRLSEFRQIRNSVRVPDVWLFINWYITPQDEILRTVCEWVLQTTLLPHNLQLLSDTKYLTSLLTLFSHVFTGLRHFYVIVQFIVQLMLYHSRYNYSFILFYILLQFYIVILWWLGTSWHQPSNQKRSFVEILTALELKVNDSHCPNLVLSHLSYIMYHHTKFRSSRSYSGDMWFLERFVFCI